MTYQSSEHISNEGCLSMLLQILEDPMDGDLYPVFYISTGEDSGALTLENLTALSMALAHAKDKVDSVIAATEYE